MTPEAINQMIAVYAKDILGENPSPKAQSMLVALCQNIERETRHAATAAINACAHTVSHLNQ